MSIDGDQNSSGIITEADEIAHYDDVAASPEKYEVLYARVERVRQLQTSWTVPVVQWLDSVPDCVSQADVYIYLSSSIVGGRVLQIGGTGQAALKALVGGASAAKLITPSSGEAELAERVARDLGVADRFSTAIGFAESLPVSTESVDAIISEACMHHTNLAAALRECSRVLVEGGRFAAWEPWKARLYTIGISVFGKRDPDVNCRPIDSTRIAELGTIFPRQSELRLHGCITRYPGIVWSRYIKHPRVTTSYRWTRLDDLVSHRIPVLARNGSSCSILAMK